MMRKAENIPTPDEVARAMLAASDQTGERALLVEAARNGAHLGKAALRCKWVAIAALAELYPRFGLSGGGRLLDLASPSERVASARRAAWWPSRGGLDRVIAAI